MQSINVNSEIGQLRGVILHTPGLEVEKMTPENAERALYSDILNLSVALNEYNQFKGVLSKYCHTYEVKELLSSLFENKQVKSELLKKVCNNEAVPELYESLLNLPNNETAIQLIEGVDLIRDNLTRYLSNERYSLRPLHNFLFTRDASISIYNKVLIGKMANNVREREAVLMNYIIKHHPLFNAKTINANNAISNQQINQIQIEGGDVLVVKEDILVIGTGIRTSTHGVDFIIDNIKSEKKGLHNIIVQELPETPESFIHLDMVFTLLDRDTCMVYEPLILNHNRYRTIHITINNGKVKNISTEPNLIVALKKAGMHLQPVLCGGNDIWHQEREQWHSGANFFAISPGVIIGYERNIYTIEALYNNGFEVIKANDIINNNLVIPEKKAVITIGGAELARGGGGARCMSMPVQRENILW